MNADRRLAWMLEKEREMLEQRREYEAETRRHEAKQRKIQMIGHGMSIYHTLVIAPFIMSALNPNLYRKEQ